MIELALSASALLLYRKTEMEPLVYCAASIWLAYFWEPLVILLVASLALLAWEVKGQGTLK